MTAEIYTLIIFGIFILGILILAAYFNKHLTWRREFEERKWREEKMLKQKPKGRGVRSLIPTDMPRGMDL